MARVRPGGALPRLNSGHGLRQPARPRVIFVFYSRESGFRRATLVAAGLQRARRIQGAELSGSTRSSAGAAPLLS